MTFKESVLEKLIIAAKEYSKLIGVGFLIASNEFKYRNEYLLRFHKDNFLHLTGINTKLKAIDFFNNCFDKTISLDDFDCDSSEELKGKVREKMRNLITIGKFFESDLIFQEMLEKNKVKCKIASSDGKYTLGFISINGIVHVPLTLLNRNQILEENGIRNCTITRIVR